MQRQFPSSAGGTAVSLEAFEKLASSAQAMQRSISSLTEQMHSSTGTGGASGDQPVTASFCAQRWCLLRMGSTPQIPALPQLPYVYAKTKTVLVEDIPLLLQGVDLNKPTFIHAYHPINPSNCLHLDIIERTEPAHPNALWQGVSGWS